MERLIKHVNLWVVILIALLIGQSLVLGVAVDRLDQLWKQVNPPGREMNYQTSELVHDSIQGLYRDATVDAPTDRVYLPDARIYLPYNEQSKRIVYNYQPADGKFPSQLTLDATPYVNYLPINFSEVPCIQGLVDVSVNKNIWSSGTTAVKLDDARTLYLRPHSSQANQNQCKAWWADFGPTQMIDLFKQAKSY